MVFSTNFIFIKGVDVDYLAAKIDITALADVMKQFFREMPECLLQFSLYAKFLDVLRTLQRAFCLYISTHSFLQTYLKRQHRQKSCVLW